MSIRDWPAAERPREKLLERGERSFRRRVAGDFSANGRVPAKARWTWREHLLSHFGSLRALLEADRQPFSASLGLGPAKFAQLQALLEMGRRHLAERSRHNSALESPLAVRELPQVDAAARAS